MRDFTQQIINIMKDGNERNAADILTDIGFELHLLYSSEKDSFKHFFWKHQVRPLIQCGFLKQIFDGEFSDGQFVIINPENLV